MRFGLALPRASLEHPRMILEEWRRRPEKARVKRECPRVTLAHQRTNAERARMNLAHPRAIAECARRSLAHPRRRKLCARRSLEEARRNLERWRTRVCVPASGQGIGANDGGVPASGGFGCKCCSFNKKGCQKGV